MRHAARRARTASRPGPRLRAPTPAPGRRSRQGQSWRTAPPWRPVQRRRRELGPARRRPARREPGRRAASLAPTVRRCPPTRWRAMWRRLQSVPAPGGRGRGPAGDPDRAHAPGGTPSRLRRGRPADAGSRRSRNAPRRRFPGAAATRRRTLGQPRLRLGPSPSDMQDLCPVHPTDAPVPCRVGEPLAPSRRGLGPLPGPA